MKTNESVRLDSIVTSTDLTGKVTMVRGWKDGSGDSYDADWTDETVKIRSQDNSIFEYAVATSVDGVITFSMRGLDSSSAKTEVTSNKLDWRPGAIIEVVASASDIVDRDGDNIFGGDNTFTGINTFSESLIATKKFRLPSFVDLAARTAAYPSPVDGDECQVAGDAYHYNGTTMQWEAFGVSTPLPNASEIVAGKVQQATDAKFLAGNDTGSTGAPNFVVPSQVQGLINDSPSKTALVAADKFLLSDSEAAGIYKETSFDDIKRNIVSNTIDSTTLAGEDIAANMFVSLMPDNKFYQLNNNIRTLGTVAGVSTTTSWKSAVLPNDKIVTIGYQSNTLHAYVGTINQATNVVTYGTGVQITTASLTDFYVSDTGVNDAFTVMWRSTDQKTVNAIAATISGTVPTIGGTATVYSIGSANNYGVIYDQSICSIDSGKVVYVYPGAAFNALANTNTRCGTISGTTITLGTEVAGISGSGGNNGRVVKVDTGTVFLGGGNGNGTNTFSSYLATISGTTMTLGTVVTLSGATINAALASDGTYCYSLNLTDFKIRKYSVSGNTLTLIYTSTAVTSTPIGLIIYGHGGLGVVYANSVVWYAETGTDIQSINTTSFTPSMARYMEQTYSTNYFTMTVSGSDPATIIKIGNEIRNTAGYTLATISRGAAGNVYTKGLLDTGVDQFNIGQHIYARASNGGFTGYSIVYAGRAKTARIIDLLFRTT